MNQPTTEAELKQARRNQTFTNASSSMGQCPLKAQEVAVFPVRYALDESPQSKGSPQGPHPLPKAWPGKPPELKTRSYTLRQLRDGWLYVWNSVDQTFHEYQVTAENFTRHRWTDAELNKDTRNNPGETQPYLLYPRRSQLRIAYSPVQWTWHLCELMRSSASEQSQWMRAVDLPAYCASGAVAHGDSITELGNSVADILVYGAQAPTFTSTLLPTTATGPDMPSKAAFEEALVRGRVPEQDTALFVALDDPLAMVDDLSMNLAGRLMEYSRFETLHQERLQSASAVLNLCGFDVDAFMPSSLKDPFQRQAYTDDLYTLLDAHDDVARGQELVPGDQAGMVDLAAASAIADAEAPFKARWGHLPDSSKWQKALESWHAKRLWREDVRFNDVQKYLSQTTAEAQRLQEHCQRSEYDLLTWLDQLSPSAEAVYHDTCQEDQASSLLETAHALYTLLGNGENGQQWLCRQAAQPDTLFGMALFNFNPEVARLIKQVTHNFSTFGTLDDQGRQGDGSAPTLTPGVSDVTNLGTRANELKGVLDLESVQNSKLYRNMSITAKHALDTLIKVANDQARSAWHGLTALLLPGIKPEAALTLAVPQVLISTEISLATQLLYNPHWEQSYQNWLGKIATVNKEIIAAKGILGRPGHVHDHRAARLSLQRYEDQLKTLSLMRPMRIIGKANGHSRLPPNHTQLNLWLTGLGQSEVLRQLTLFGTQEHQTHVREWMNSRLGSALPALLVGLNLWNVHDTATKARKDGRFSADELRNLGAAMGYAGNAIAALWVGPAWNRAGGMSATLGRDTLKVAQAGYLAWLRDAKAASRGSTQAALANEFATVSKGLILRTVTWAALGMIAAGVEAWQLSKDAGRATSPEEETLLWTKFAVVTGMSIVAGVQTIGTALGYWFGFAWVMSTPIAVILALLGIAYLMITMAANRYKREGLRLWLYRCSWGHGSTDQVHVVQMQALLRILQRPSVVGRAVQYSGHRNPRASTGFWVQIQLPASLAGTEVTLQPAIFEKLHLSRDERQATSSHFYEQFLQGNWVDPQQLGTLPSEAGDQYRPKDFTYAGTEQHRLWQAWVELRIDSPILGMAIKYPWGILQHVKGVPYRFRLALDWDAGEADRTSEVSVDELKEDADIVLTENSNELVQLAIPD